MTVATRGTLATVDLGPSGHITIPCGDAQHRGEVCGSELRLLDHDLAAEAALLVFGAPVPPCLLYQRAWIDAFTDPFFAAWSADGDGVRSKREREDWYENFWESWPTDPAAARALFGPALQDRLAIEVAKCWVDSRGPDGPGAAWSAVRRAVSTRARGAFVSSLARVHAHRRPDALVPVAITVVPEGAAGIAGHLSLAGSVVDLRLPVAWLADVWCRRLAVVDGRFVLGADDDGTVLDVIEWRPAQSGTSSRRHEPHVVRVRRQPRVA